MATTSFFDWQRYQVPGANQVISDSTGPTTSYTSATVDVSQWKYLLIYVTNFDSAAYLEFGADWTGFAGALTQQPHTQFIVGPNQSARISIPVVDREFFLNLDAVNGVPAAGFIYTVQGLSYPITKYDAKSQGLPLISDVSGYNANQTKTFFPNYWYEGPVMVNLGTQNGTPGFASFQYYNMASAGFVEYATIAMVATNNEMPTKIHFPPSPIKILVENGSGAQLIGFGVTPITG